MGSHAKPRTRVRSAALGALAVGATLTGVGLTAAALDPAMATADNGPFTTDPVDYTAGGLGAPVPVTDSGSYDGVTVRKGTLPGAGGAVSTRAPSPAPTTIASPFGGVGTHIRQASVPARALHVRHGPVRTAPVAPVFGFSGIPHMHPGPVRPGSVDVATSMPGLPMHSTPLALLTGLLNAIGRKLV